MEETEKINDFKRRIKEEFKKIEEDLSKNKDYPRHKIEGIGEVVAEKGRAGWADIKKLKKVYVDPYVTYKNGKRIYHDPRNLAEKASNFFTKVKRHLVKNDGIFWRGILSNKAKLTDYMGKNGDISWAGIKRYENKKALLENIEDIVCATAIALPAALGFDHLLNKYVAQNYDKIINFYDNIFEFSNRCINYISTLIK